MASKAEQTARRTNTTAKRLRDEIADQSKRYREKMRKVRDKKIPNAMINTGIAGATGVATGVYQGLVPETMVIMERQIPTGLIADAGGVLLGVVVGGGSALAGLEMGVHAGGGIATVSMAGLARQGTKWMREQAMVMWNERNKKNNAGAAPGGVQLAA